MISKRTCLFIERNGYLKELANNKELFEDQRYKVREILFSIIEESINSNFDEKLKKASAAITLLNYTGYTFIYTNLEGIKIPHADLSFS